MSISRPDSRLVRWAAAGAIEDRVLPPIDADPKWSGLFPIGVVARERHRTLNPLTLRPESRPKPSWQPRPSATRAAPASRPDDLDRSLAAHYVTVGDDGTLVGQLSVLPMDTTAAAVAVEGLKVYLVQNSNIVAEAETNAGGQFEFRDVPTGDFALCAAGQNGFLAFGLHVLRQEGEGQPDSEDWIPLPGAEEDLTQVRFGSRARPLALQVSATVVPPKFSTLRQIMTDRLPVGVSASIGEGSDTQLNVDDSGVADDYRIALTPQGELAGRVAPLSSGKDKPVRVREMNAFLIQNDEVYARVAVNEDGTFVFGGVEPGRYSFAAAGKDGFAAIGFEAIPPVVPDPAEDTGRLDDGTWYVAWPSPNRQAGGLQVALSPSTESDFLVKQIQQLSPKPEQQTADDQSPENNQSPPDDDALGGFGGVGGGMGGGIPGGLGGAGVGAALLAGGAVAALVGDNSSNYYNPVPPGKTPPPDGGPPKPPGPPDVVPEPVSGMVWSLLSLVFVLGRWDRRGRVEHSAR